MSNKKLSPGCLTTNTKNHLLRADMTPQICFWGVSALLRDGLDQSSDTHPLALF